MARGSKSALSSPVRSDAALLHPPRASEPLIFDVTNPITHSFASAGPSDTDTDKEHVCISYIFKSNEWHS
jgi:hypothetical protein